MIQGLNHFTVIADDMERTLDFYVGVLGLREGPRPDFFGFAGAWLYAGATPIVHLYADRAAPAVRAGVIDHIAFSAQGLREMKARFDERGLEYELRQQKGAGTWQLFCYDPNGAKVELDFDRSETL